MLRAIWMTFLVLLGSVSVASAWEDTAIAHMKKSRTRIAELNLTADSADNVNIIGYVRFVDDTSEVCLNGHRFRDPYDLAGRDIRAYVMFGHLLGNQNRGAMLGMLLAARAGNHELDVVIDIRECRVVQMSL